MLGHGRIETTGLLLGEKPKNAPEAEAYTHSWRLAPFTELTGEPSTPFRPSHGWNNAGSSLSRSSAPSPSDPNTASHDLTAETPAARHGGSTHPNHPHPHPEQSRGESWSKAVIEKLPHHQQEEGNPLPPAQCSPPAAPQGRSLPC